MLLKFDKKQPERRLSFASDIMLNVDLVGLIGLFYFALGHNKTKLKSHDSI